MNVALVQVAVDKMDKTICRPCNGRLTFQFTDASYHVRRHLFALFSYKIWQIVAWYEYWCHAWNSKQRRGVACSLDVNLKVSRLRNSHLVALWFWVPSPKVAIFFISNILFLAYSSKNINGKNIKKNIITVCFKYFCS